VHRTLPGIRPKAEAPLSVDFAFFDFASFLPPFAYFKRFTKWLFFDVFAFAFSFPFTLKLGGGSRSTPRNLLGVSKPDTGGGGRTLTALYAVCFPDAISRGPGGGLKCYHVFLPGVLTLQPSVMLSPCCGNTIYIGGATLPIYPRSWVGEDVSVASVGFGAP